MCATYDPGTRSGIELCVGVTSGLRRESWLSISGSIEPCVGVIIGSRRESWFLVSGPIEPCVGVTSGLRRESWFSISGSIEPCVGVITGSHRESWCSRSSDRLNPPVQSRGLYRESWALVRERKFLTGVTADLQGGSVVCLAASDSVRETPFLPRTACDFVSLALGKARVQRYSGSRQWL